MSIPSMKSRPGLGLYRRTNRLTRVVLPLPGLRPMMARVLPRGNRILMPLSASVPLG